MSVVDIGVDACPFPEEYDTPAFVPPWICGVDAWLNLSLADYGR